MDQKTLDYYKANAKELVQRYESVASSLAPHFALAFSPGGRVLDIGCGSGRDLAELHKLGFQSFGLDGTPQLVELAQQLHSELKGRVIWATLPEFDAPFGGGFDGVICCAVLMHIQEDQLVLAARSIKRCLKERGRLLYSVPSKRLDVVAGNRDVNGRLFIPDQSHRLQPIFEQLGFTLICKWNNADSLGRDSVEWISVLMELTNA